MIQQFYKIKVIAFVVSSLISSLSVASEISLRVLKQPSISKIDGKNNLIYELVIENKSSSDVQVKEITIDAKEFGSLNLRDSELGSRFKLLSQINLETVPDLLAVPKPPVLAMGLIPTKRAAVVFLQLKADAHIETPSFVYHKVVVQSGKGLSVRLINKIQIARSKILVLGSPFSQGVWFPFNGPSDQSAHSRSVLRIHDKYYIAQRYAIDWMQIGDHGYLVAPGTSSKENPNYVGYGTSIHAVAEGVIEKITDEIPENVPDSDTRAVTINLQNVTGNSVILKMGENQFALYAHLQPGSLKVKPGERVKKGQIIGLLGNSGNSTGPHLHLHVCDGPSALQCQGIPYVFESFSHQEVETSGESIGDMKFTPKAHWNKSSQQLIWTNQQIAF